MKSANQQLFIAWTKYQRRAASMQPYFGYELKFVPTTIKKPKVVDYLIKLARTVCCLLAYRPKILWTQLPPTFLTDLAILYRKIFKRKAVIIADCHNGVFWGKWERFLNVNKLNKYDIIIVHNWAIKNIAVDKGIDDSKIVILETKPAHKSLNNVVDPKKSGCPQVLMPCGFSVDEPLEIVFDAAQKIPEIDILVSGPKERGESLFDYNKKPDNVHLIGYLSKKDYETVFLQSDLVLGLTTEDHIQLSVANEAAGFEIPMVISNTKLLQDLFNKGAVYVETLNADSIANGIKNALQHLDSLREDVKVLKKERNQKWENMASALNKKIEKLTITK